MMKSIAAKKKVGKRARALAGSKKTQRLKPAPKVDGGAGLVAALLEERRSGR